MINDRDILTAKELALKLKVSHETVYEMVRQNQIPHKKIRRQIRFVGWKINEWLAGQ